MEKTFEINKGGTSRVSSTTSLTSLYPINLIEVLTEKKGDKNFYNKLENHRKLKDLIKLIKYKKIKGKYVFDIFQKLKGYLSLEISNEEIDEIITEIVDQLKIVVIKDYCEIKENDDEIIYLLGRELDVLFEKYVNRLSYTSTYEFLKKLSENDFFETIILESYHLGKIEEDNIDEEMSYYLISMYNSLSSNHVKKIILSLSKLDYFINNNLNPEVAEHFFSWYMKCKEKYD